MPANYARRLMGPHRSTDANRQLGVLLAFVAGGINAGGFLAVQQYTSHMTGMVSVAADSLVLGTTQMAASSLGGLLSFLAGAACAAVMVNYARRHEMGSVFAMPLLLEAGLLLCFGVLGSQLAGIPGLFVPVTVMLLCFMMGLQNALISKLSHSEIRSTHVTGVVTDIGIELGKLLYWNHPGAAPDLPRVRTNWPRLRLLLALLAAFFVGGVTGALGFKTLGYVATLPLALVLVLTAGVPALDDLGRWLRRGRQPT